MMIHSTEGVNSNKNQKAILRKGHNHPNLLNQRNLSEQRNIQYKPTQQQHNGLLLEHNISQQENIQFNVNRIQQGSSCQIQYFFPKSVKRGARNRTPGNESKSGFSINSLNDNEQQNILIHAKSGDCDFKTTQAQFCEVDINLLQKRDISRKPVSNSVAQSLATKNVNDLMNQQKRSSSSKAISSNNTNNLISTQVILQESQNSRQQMSSAQKGQSRTPKNNKTKLNSQLTPSLERKKNSNSVISNKRSTSINKQVAQQPSQGSQKKNDNKPIVIQQQSKQPQLRLASKSSLQKNRKSESIRYRIKTVGNEEDDSDEGFNPEIINLNNLEDNDTPLSKFKDVILSNQKQQPSDLLNPPRYPPKIKFQRDVGRVQGNIQECTVLKNFLNQGEHKLQQQKGNSNQSIQLKQKDATDKSPNAKLINSKQVNMSGNQLVKTENQGVEVNRIRAISSNGVRKRILTKSNEKLRTNLHINTDNYCEIDLPQQSLYQAGGAATTTLDSKGSTKHTNTIKFSSRIDTQSLFNNNKAQLNNNPKLVKVNSSSDKGNQNRAQRIKTEGDEVSLPNYSPSNPKTYNVNNYLHLSNKLEEDRLFKQDNFLVQYQPQSNKSHNSDVLLFTSQKKSSNKSNQDIKYLESDQQKQCATNQVQENTIQSDQIISPQFQKLRFKNTQAITYERNYSADGTRNKQNQDLNSNLKQLKKKKLMIKTINPYKSEEKKEISSQSETPSSAHSSIMFSSIGNNNGILTKNTDTFSKSPLSLRKSDGVNIVKSHNQQGILQSQFSSGQQNFENQQNVRESIASDYQSNQIYQSVQHNYSSKKMVDWIEITSPNNIHLSSDQNSNAIIDNKKQQKIMLRPTKVTSNERKNNNNSSNGSRSQIKQLCNTNSNNNILQSSQNIANNQILYNSNNQQINQKGYFSVPMQLIAAPQQNLYQESGQQKNYFSSQKFTNEFRLSVETFQPSEKKDKNQSTNSLLSSSNNNNPNFNIIFNSNKSNDAKELKTIKQQINFYSNIDEDQQKQKQILDSIKSDAMKSILRQSLEKGKDQSQFQSDSIQELQKDLHEMKLNVQIENMNQNFATLNKNLKEMNNDLNLEYSNIIPRDSRSNILENIDSYHFDKIPENDSNNHSKSIINCHVSILNNNQQDSFKYTNETSQNDNQQAEKMQQLVNNFDFSDIQEGPDDKDIMSQLEKEKTEFEQKLLQEKIKFEQRQQQLKQEFIYQKQKLIQQQQMRLKNSNGQASSVKNQFEQNQSKNNSLQNKEDNFALSPFSSQEQQDVKEQNHNQQRQNLNMKKNNSFTQYPSNCGQKMLQFADKSLDLSFTKNPNLENDVSKLFRQEQISQILPESQCSFLSEVENILETNNNSNLFTNGGNQAMKNQNIHQGFNQDGINVINLQNQSSAKNISQSTKFQENQSAIQKQNFFPTISPQSSSQSLSDKQYKHMNSNNQQFPNIHINANMVNIPKQQRKNNFQIHEQIQQQLVIEEQDCEQSQDSSIQIQYHQQNKIANFNSQNSNRMPPLPLNVGQLQKLKKNNLCQTSQKFSNLKN
ncbi:hypothetical protein TTHERM_00566830 (macronuclear) [Tetrahymena thermophila SB210]|uniref:Uncharacterized protein n=1 Tax=Tetrahymena thermophila (strain SB210) TaxID=312017 RepID=I7LWI0_TETTS|nr:hypothetical protein TTHERM_00566830 [Tetrahymena thermophila SB210]EAS01839.2 hypothetical protein TTHERM_00566830 [Tetrahymena thermophila SB210]|eukprot:XP_001022084.2 hypothetical protein TTHERM_00566830 [Tetrahymena thermophila SB210]